MQVNVVQKLVGCGQALRHKQSPVTSHQGWLKLETGAQAINCEISHNS